MPIKKSDLYAKLWASCDELRGGMDASEYKDYVLVMLFIKYVSDKYAGQPFAPIQITPGASFADLVALKGRSDISDQINKTIIRPLEEATMTTSARSSRGSRRRGPRLRNACSKATCCSRVPAKPKRKSASACPTSMPVRPTRAATSSSFARPPG
jgi:hypothetical protein